MSDGQHDNRSIRELALDNALTEAMQVLQDLKQAHCTLMSLCDSYTEYMRAAANEIQIAINELHQERKQFAGLIQRLTSLYERNEQLRDENRQLIKDMKQNIRKKTGDDYSVTDVASRFRQ